MLMRGFYEKMICVFLSKEKCIQDLKKGYVNMKEKLKIFIRFN